MTTKNLARIRVLPAARPAQDLIELDSLLPKYATYLTVKGNRPRGVEKYLWTLKAFVAWLGPGATPQQLTRRAIEHYRDSKVTNSPATIGNLLTCIRSLCRWLVREELLADDPTKLVEWPKRRKPLPRALKRSSLQQLTIALADSPSLTPKRRWTLARNRRVVFLMLYAGLRLSEVADLQWEHIDLAGRSLFVQQGKGGKDRLLPLNPTLQAELEQVPLAERAGAVAGRPDGRCMGFKSIAHIFERYLTRRGLKISAHQLRHSFATEMLRAGASIKHIQELMGHESLETTQRYLSLDVDQLSAAVALLPATW